MEDTTPYVNVELPSRVKARLDRLFPAGWNVTRTGPDVIHALEKVREFYATDITPDNGPRLIRDWEKTWESREPTLPWAIVWEQGPDDWAIQASHADIFDRSRVFAEPGNGWVLALCQP